MWVNGLFVLCPIEGKLCPITPAAQGSVFKNEDTLRDLGVKEQTVIQLVLKERKFGG